MCPKKPDFSDVSHLLTHIASKGHLSHYYKLKVRAATEPAARDDIEQYDNWYADSNIESLMSERMAQKDAKRSRARSAQGSSGRLYGQILPLTTPDLPSSLTIGTLGRSAC